METAINLTAIIISVISILLSLTAIIMVVAQKWSSHKIEFRPLEVNDPFKEDETFKKFEEPEDITIEQALKLSQEGLERKKKKKQDEDPLDSILESNNF